MMQSQGRSKLPRDYFTWLAAHLDFISPELRIVESIISTHLL